MLSYFHTFWVAYFHTFRVAYFHSVAAIFNRTLCWKSKWPETKYVYQMEEQKSGNQVCTSRQKVDFWCNVKKRISDVALKSSGERCVSLAFLHCVFEKTFKKPQWRKAKNDDLGIKGRRPPVWRASYVDYTLLLFPTLPQQCAVHQKFKRPNCILGQTHRPQSVYL